MSGGAEGPQEGAEDGLGFGGARLGALEVHVELAVGEVRAGGVRDVHGEGGLADAADAGERGDGHDLALGARQDRAELADERGASGEVGHGGGQLGGLHVDGGRGRCGVLGAGEFGVGAQDALLEGGELGAGVDAEFLGEEPAGVGVDGEGLGLAAAAVEGEHQQLAQPLAQRVGGGQRGELGDGLGVVADLQVEVQAGLQQLDAPFGEPGPLGLGVRAGDSGEGFAVPEVQGAGEEGTGEGAVPGGAGLLGVGGQGAGDAEVEGLHVAQPDGVPAGLADEQPGVEDLAQPGRVGADGGEGLLGRVLAPDRVDELGRGGGPAAPEQEHGEQGALLGGLPEGRASRPRQARMGPRTANRAPPGVGSAAAAGWWVSARTACTACAACTAWGLPRGGSAGAGWPVCRPSVVPPAFRRCKGQSALSCAYPSARGGAIPSQLADGSSDRRYRRPHGDFPEDHLGG
ncbi:hypothetical protein GCM10020254_48840 [Streptomyces goshikiensis]